MNELKSNFFYRVSGPHGDKNMSVFCQNVPREENRDLQMETDDNQLRTDL